MRRAAVVVGGVGITDDKLQIAVLVTVLHQYASVSHLDEVSSDVCAVMAMAAAQHHLEQGHWCPPPNQPWFTATWYPQYTVPQGPHR